MAMKKWNEQSSELLDFVGGTPVNPLSEKSKKRSVPQRSVAEPVPVEIKKKITTIHIDEQLYRDFKKFAIEKECSISDLLSAAIRDMLDGSYFPKP